MLSFIVGSDREAANKLCRSSSQDSQLSFNRHYTRKFFKIIFLTETWPVLFRRCYTAYEIWWQGLVVMYTVPCIQVDMQAYVYVFSLLCLAPQSSSNRVRQLFTLYHCGDHLRQKLEPT